LGYNASMKLALILLASATVCTAIVVTICRACEVKRSDLDAYVRKL